MKKDTNPVRLSEIDFLISTYDNRPGLERVIRSVLDLYPTAKITIADSAESIDRSYYKSLRAEVDGVNRIVVHHIAYKASLGRAFNELVSRSKSNYKLLLTDEDVITTDTDIEAMIRVMRSNKTIGVVGGHINTVEESKQKALKTDEGDVFTETTVVNRFMVLYTDVFISLRFNETADDFAVDFSNRAKGRLPYKMAMSGAVITSDKDYDNEENDEQSDGEDTGANAPGDVQDPAGGPDAEGGSDLDSSSSRENETSKDTTPRRRSSRGSA